MQFRNLALDDLENVVGNERIPVELLKRALVVRIENAIIKTRFKSILIARIHECANHISLVAAVGDAVVVAFRRPETRAGYVLRYQNRVFGTQVMRYPDPLPHIEVSWTVRARRSPPTS